ncbi:GNAT family N-acetyltransferase [Photobacterium sanguinicancri]|uniref:GNAT family N-acetyltransferase n=1 Tax=Photobacterium sanguinicancri TaxID=875932 RepID=UPI0021C45F96|nr:GNAT family N-acetyltransferase [Photobacterium sanguinicancri]
MSISDKELNLVPYDRVFLNASWIWLNDPEIKNLVLSEDFSKEQQEKFYLSLPDRDDYKIWGLKYGTTAIGTVGIKNINLDSGEFFCYIGDKSYWNKGLSCLIFSLIETEAYKLAINRLWLTVSLDNVRAIKSYKKNGFSKVSLKSNAIIMERYFDR